MLLISTYRCSLSEFPLLWAVYCLSVPGVVLFNRALAAVTARHVLPLCKVLASQQPYKDDDGATSRSFFSHKDNKKQPPGYDTVRAVMKDRITFHRARASHLVLFTASIYSLNKGDHRLFGFLKSSFLHICSGYPLDETRQRL